MPRGLGRPITKPQRHLLKATQAAQAVAGRDNPTVRENRRYLMDKTDQAFARRKENARSPLDRLVNPEGNAPVHNKENLNWFGED